MSERNICCYSQGNVEFLSGICVAIVKAMLSVLAAYASL